VPDQAQHPLQEGLVNGVIFGQIIDADDAAHGCLGRLEDKRTNQPSILSILH
jgi:hypothetical protein